RTGFIRPVISDSNLAARSLYECGLGGRGPPQVSEQFQRTLGLLSLKRLRNERQRFVRLHDTPPGYRHHGTFNISHNWSDSVPCSGGRPNLGYFRSPCYLVTQPNVGDKKTSTRRPHIVLRTIEAEQGRSAAFRRTR